MWSSLNRKPLQQKVRVVLWGCVVSCAVILCPAERTEAMDLKFLANLFMRAEEATGMPRYLLAAIAAQESSFNPWSINLSGQSYYGESKDDALAHIGDCENFDLGLMQINSQWLARLRVSAEDALDPAMNLTLGSLILMDCVTRYGIRGGIACYHAGDPQEAGGIEYAAKIIEKWRILVNDSAELEGE